MRNKRLWATVLSLVLPLAIGSAGERKFDKTVPASMGGTLRLVTDLGSVRIIGSDAAEVAVSAMLKGSGRDVDAFTITVEPAKGGVEVTGKAKGKRGWFWNTTELDVEFTIRVPKTYNLELHTSGGDLNVSSVKGTLQGETSGGSIRVKGVEGEIRVETSGGDIRVDGVVGNLKGETSGGSIEIGDVNGDADVETSGGNIKLGKVSGRVRAETSGGNIRVLWAGGGKGISAETSGGNIDIGVPAGIGATIDASTSGGDVDCDLPVTVSGKVRESSLRGTINGGGATIRARTSGGSIRIKGAD